MSTTKSKMVPKRVKTMFLWKKYFQFRGGNFEIFTVLPKTSQIIFYRTALKRERAHALPTNVGLLILELPLKEIAIRLRKSRSDFHLLKLLTEFRNFLRACLLGGGNHRQRG